MGLSFLFLACRCASGPVRGVGLLWSELLGVSEAEQQYIVQRVMLQTNTTTVYYRGSVITCAILKLTLYTCNTSRTPFASDYCAMVEKDHCFHFGSQ